MKRIRQWAICSLALLAFSLPFEAEIIGLAPAGFQFTNLEIVLGLVLLFVLFIVAKEQKWKVRNVPAGWLWLWGWVIGAALLSAIFAPNDSFNSLKAVIRLTSGIALAVAVPQIVSRPEQQRPILIALLAGGLLSVVIGLLEMVSHQRFPWLTIFRAVPTSVGPFDRLSASFDHANQAGSYFAATLPLLIAFGWQQVRQASRPKLAIGLLFFILLLYLQAIIFTYSRASLLTVFLTHGFIAILLWPNRQQGLWLATIGLLLLSFAAHVWLNPAVRLRLTSEDDRDWYGLHFTIPEQLTLPAGQMTPITLSVRNDGPLTWSSRSSNPVNIGGHWLLTDGQSRLLAEPRWPLPEVISPGETLTTTVQLLAPLKTGTYQLEWDMVQENVVWFSFKNQSHFISQVTVIESYQQQLTLPQETAEALNRTMIQPPVPAPIPGRSTLWQIALELFRQHPLFGIGLDNFRLTYGQVLGVDSWNTTIHTNNWYLETLVSLGFFGSTPFFLWLAILGLDIGQNLFRPGKIVSLVALATALLTYFLHGLLDYFLMFNPNGLLFWLLIGLWLVNKLSNNEQLSDNWH